MASLIRSAQIVSKRRLLEGGESPAKKSERQSAPAEQQTGTDDSTMRREADLRALSQARTELEEALRISQARTTQTEAELLRLRGDIDELRQDAVESGRESGYQAGREEGRAELTRQAAQLSELIEQVTKEHEAKLTSAEEEIVEVVFTSVAKILGDTLVSADAVIAVVRQSIKQLVTRDRLAIHLSPEDKKLLDKVAAEGDETLFGYGIEIVADERIELGGCILQSMTGGLDARLEVQMRQLSECLLSVANRRKGESQ
ncbi:FliH/SctL family protein [Candidatus Thiodiazotropha sp. CDECU1]|uniref:FliH/SctL family protein n=1 Tax=Candidatus Thiodiazotropha sp. CDECU1 TaxID=3065865 RepID=UPI00292CC559|nr:FliH/SctL family protein [Candidatus Thiodiazotropha sp. CDECU1]